MESRGSLVSQVTFIALVILVFSIWFLKEKLDEKPVLSPINKESLAFSAGSEILGFYELEPNYNGKIYKPDWIPYTPDIEYNSEGFNERFEYEILKPSRTFRIMNIGDSWAYGQYVDTHDNYSEKLEDMLNENLKCSDFDKFEVINMGVPSYDLKYAVERFKIRGAKFNPDLVLWFVIENDFSEINEYLKPRTKEIMQELAAENFNNTEEEFNRFSVPPSNLDNDIWIKALEEQKKEISQEETLLYQEKALWSLDEHFKGKVLLVYFPKQSFNSSQIKTINNFVSERGKTEKLELLFDYNEDLRLPDNHPNQKGHKKIAEAIYKFLTEKKLICQ